MPNLSDGINKVIQYVANILSDRWFYTVVNTSKLYLVICATCLGHFVADNEILQLTTADTQSDMQSILSGGETILQSVVMESTQYKITLPFNALHCIALAVVISF